MSSAECLTERDEIEKLLNSSVESMSAGDLLCYVQGKYKETFGYALAIDGHPERATLKWLKRVYMGDAGLILKFFFTVYEGQSLGEKFTMSMFCSARKWWIDRLRSEMMDLKRALSEQGPLSEGFVNARRLLDK